MDAHGETRYNSYIRNGRALLEAAPTVSQDGVSVVTNPIVVSPCEINNSKTCITCGESKPLTDFDLRKGSKDGRRNQCRACRRAYIREWGGKNPGKLKQYWAERIARIGRDEINARNRESYQSNKDAILQRRHERADEIRAANRKSYEKNCAKRREKAKVNYAEHREERTAWQRRYYAKHTDERRKYAIEYYKANKARFFAGNRRRRSRILHAQGMHTDSDLEAVRLAQTDKKGRLICWCCGYPIVGTNPPPIYPDAPRLPRHIDHWIPLSKEGTNHAGNLHYVHGICNLKKGASHPTTLGRLL